MYFEIIRIIFGYFAYKSTAFTWHDFPKFLVKFHLCAFKKINKHFKKNAFTMIPLQHFKMNQII